MDKMLSKESNATSRVFPLKGKESTNPFLMSLDFLSNTPIKLLDN
jgi:hypothetical protein